MNEKITYRHRHIGSVFMPILSIGSEGFEHKGRSYKWSDINKIKRYDSAFWSLMFYQAGTPLTYLYLNDGTRIKIRGRVLEKEGEKSKVSFVEGSTEAYSQLIELIVKMKKQIAQQ